MPLTVPIPFSGDLPLSGAKLVNAWGATQAGQNFEPYVVPSGRKAIWSYHSYNNFGGVAGSASTQVKRADDSYRNVQPVFGFTAGGGSGASNPIVLNAGERPSIVAPTMTVNANLRVTEFDDTPYIVRADADLVAGDNVLFTVPEGFVAVICSLGSPPASGFGSTTPHVIVSNVSGVSRTYAFHIFPAGVNESSPATRWSGNGAVANNALVSFGASGTRNVLTAGEKLVINSDGSGAGQWAWANLLLIPA